MILNSPFLQSKIVHVFSSIAKQKYGVDAQIRSVNFVFPETMILNHLVIYDQTGDTLIASNSLRIDFNTIAFQKHEISLDLLRIDNPYINLHQFPDSTWNYDFLTSSDTINTDTLNESWSVKANDLRIVAGKFLFDKVTVPIDSSGSMDYSHLKIDSLYISVADLIWADDTLKTQINRLALKESCGFVLEELSADLVMDKQKIDLHTMHLMTNESNLIGDLKFEYEQIGDFTDFNELVNIRADLNNSDILFNDIGYFAPALIGNKLKLILTGKIRGTVDNFKGRNLTITGPGNLKFIGGLDLVGLPKIERTFISLRIKQLSASRKDLQKTISDINLTDVISLPANLSSLGQMKYQGNFDGFINDFVSFGSLKTDIGQISFDMALRESKIHLDDYEFEGKLNTKAFDLGVFYSDTLLGKLTTDLSVNGSGLTMETVDAHVEGKVISLALNNYNYKNINVLGKLTQNLFYGKVSIVDPNLVMDFDGNLDFRKTIPRLNFEAAIAHADLKKLNIHTQSKEASFNAFVDIDATGLKLNDFNGTINLLNANYCDGVREYDVSKITFEAKLGEVIRNITIASPMLDASLIGEFKPNKLGEVYQRLISHSLPSLLDSAMKYELNTEYIFQANFKDINPIIGLFDDQIYIAENTKILSEVSASNHTFLVDLKSDSLGYGEKRLNNVIIFVESKNEVLKAEVTADSFRLANNLALNNLSILSKSFLDNFTLGIGWNNMDFGNSGNLEMVGMITNKNRFDCDILPSEVNIGEDHWLLSNSAHITLQENYVRVSDLNIYNSNEHFTINGVVSESERDKLHVDIKEFQLANLNPLIGLKDDQLIGSLSGKATLANLFTHPIIDLSSEITELFFNDYALGDVTVNSIWNNETSTASVYGFIKKGQDKVVSLAGDYKPFEAEEPLNLDVSLNAFEVKTLNLIETDAISNLDGHANGKIHVSGNFSKPRLDGKIKLNKTHITVNYLNTSYIFNNEITIKPDYFGLNYVPVLDENGNTANVVATVFHENFSDWNFDVYLEPQNFLCLNTTSKDNNLYYGKALITGTVGIYGYSNNLDIDITAKTEPKTDIAIPLENSGIAGEQDFVTFVNHQSADLNINKEVNLEGVRLNLNLEVTPSAQVQLIFDESLGDVMKGRGSGNIKMEINTLGNFNMFGQYVIDEGDYLFTLQKIINKKFLVKKGGTINWYGSPYGAEIDLTAVYKTKAPIYDILTEKLESYKNRVPVECEMNLKGNLLKPNVSFDINLPGLNENLKNEIKSQMSTDEELNKQVFAILVLNRFLPSSNNPQNGGSGLGNATTSELISSQITGWLSQISREFDVGFVYRIGDKISNEELAVALSTQLFNERLTLSGNFGVSNGNQTNQNNNSLIGDFSVDYSLTKDGRIKLKAFNESNEYDLLNTNQATSRQGVGVFYQEDFDKFSDLLKNMFRGFRYKETTQDSLVK
jgi:hypothetical protein